MAEVGIHGVNPYAIWLYILVMFVFAALVLGGLYRWYRWNERASRLQKQRRRWEREVRERNGRPMR